MNAYDRPADGPTPHDAGPPGAQGAPVTLERLRAVDALAPLDVHFARAVGRLTGASKGSEARLRALAFAAASRAVQRGHVCADLARLAGQPPTSDAEETVEADLEGPLRWPDLAGWRAALADSPAVTVDPPTTGDATTPLVLDRSDRLYLARYWHYQQRLAGDLAARAADAPPEIDADALADGLDRYFPPGEAMPTPNLQRVAAEIAVRRRFAVVSGGPGTGKTTTVVRLLALIIEQALAAGRPPPAIRLMAPTGKAAARMVESIRAQRDGLPAPDAVRAAIPTEATTIHRALGRRADSDTRFRHDGANPLAGDVVVVDEASMVDLALMAKLVDAVPAHARLVLLGDRHQLASVEAGAVLGDLCAAPALAPAVVELLHSWRFDPTLGIGALARAIKEADVDAGRRVLVDADVAEATLVAIPPDAHPATVAPRLAEEAAEAYRPLVAERDPAAALAALGRYRLLCAHRRGAYGVETLNAAIEDRLRVLRAIAPSERYAGRPIMVIRNDYQLGLFNGDTGIVLPAPDLDGALRAYFPADEAGEPPRRFIPARLPPHETVFAMTVHKAQGSEFDRLTLLLPPAGSPILTRELLYTGVTRAKQAVRLWAQIAAVEAAIATPVQRASGLGDILDDGPASAPTPE